MDKTNRTVQGVEIVEKTEEFPKDPLERWNWEMERLWRSFEGSICDQESAHAVKHGVISICQEFVDRGDFPADLFELDHDFIVEPNGPQMDIKVPRWLYEWMRTGELMTSQDVIKYLESPLQDYDFTKPLLIL